MQTNPSRWLWGLIPIAMLTFATFYRERPGIEDELRAHALQTLKRAGQPWADVSFDGRDATVTGTALKDGEPKAARDAVFDTWGVRVVKLKTDMKVAEAPIAPAVGPKAGLAVAPAAQADDGAAEKAKAEAEAQAAAEKAKAEAEAQAAAEKAKAEAEAQAAAEKAKAEAEAQAAAEKAKAEAEAQAAAEKAKADAEAQAPAEKVKAEAEAQAAAEKVKAEAEAQAAAEKAKAEAEAQAAAEKAKAEAEAQAAAEKAKAEAEAQAAAEKSRAEAEAQALAEKARAEAEAARKAEAAAKAREEASRKDAEAKAKAKREAELASRKTNSETKACEAKLSEAVKKDKILFQRASDELTGKSARAIARLAVIARSCPGLSIEIQGHTDNEGEPERNQKLSERRATRVKAALEEEGVAPDRLSIIGLGATQPLVENTSAQNMARNRRIEFKVFVK